ncbi:MAG: hypothetical protein RIR00_2336 [Pseudomonadota bacterium]|jgi:predicted lipid carrier protein YhbT
MLTIPDFRLPGFVARIGRQLPQWPHALTLCAGLNAARLIKWLPADDTGLFEGRSFLVAVEDTGGEARFIYRNGRFQPLFSAGGEADVSFRGSLSAYLKLLLRQEDPDTLFFNRQLSIEGDTELGLAVKNLLDAIEWPPQLLQTLRDALPTRPAGL